MLPSNVSCIWLLLTYILPIIIWTTLWPQNISYWPKMNILSAYFTILMLNCLENTLNLQFHSYGTAVKFLTWFIFKITWFYLIPSPTLLESDSILGWNTIKLLTCMQNRSIHLVPVLITFIHCICQFHQSCGINAREWASCTSVRHTGSFDCLMTSLLLITMGNGRGDSARWQSCKVPN